MPDCFRETGVVRVPLEGFDFTRDIGLVYAPHTDAGGLSTQVLVTSLVDAIVASEAV
jgi:hypothetical protein